MRSTEVPVVEEEQTVIEQVEPAPRSRFVRWLIRLAAIGLGLALFGGCAGIIGLIILSQDLPELRSLNDYRPKQATVVYDPAGRVVSRFATERRTVVAFDRIPKTMVNAVLAAEDDNFYRHKGLDYVGILRCVLKNTVSRRKKCGASTITQQTVKTFFLNPKKTYTRKLREMILAKRVEEALSKDEILYLYLNQIYFGHGAHGIQEAARVYFGKDVSKITVAEAALLAGLPQQPSRLDPYRNPERAMKRRAYVLRRLKELKKIDEATYTKTKDAPLQLDWDKTNSAVDSNNHYAAHVRGLLDQMVGEELASDGGLQVYTGIDPTMQREAESAVKEGLLALDKRQGWRGPILHLEANELRTLTEQLEKRRKKIGLKNGTTSSTTAPSLPKHVIWDLSRFPEKPSSIDVDRLAEHVRFPQLALERTFGGLVTKVDDTGKEAIVSLGGGIRVHLPLRTGLGWARKFSIRRRTARPRRPSKVLAVGDVVLVRITAIQKSKEETKEPSRDFIGVLEQRPKAEAALVAIDPSTREVRAMVGGYGIGAGRFNRVIQARRQAGSTFKPIVYGSAFASGNYSPISICLDAPRVYRDPWTGRSWKPENYSGKFEGEITLRTALTKSKNLCSVELIDKVGVKEVVKLAQTLGVESPMPRTLSLALGSGEVTPLEMANTYATIATGGMLAPPIFIRKVVAPNKEVLFETKAEPKQVVRPEITYLITSLMQSVVEDGTARRVRALERPVAGKTGTTNEARDAWFIGFTPDLVTAVWVGFDNNDPLGPRETGGRAAIPIWLQFMTAAVENMPIRDFSAPSGIVFAFIDPKSGKLAPPGFEGARSEPFLSGTEPTEFIESAKGPSDRFGPEYELQ